MGASDRSNPTASDERKKSKIARIRAILRSGQSLNRFQAERHGDHCLNSAISRLRAQGDLIFGTWERVPSRFGKPVRVLRYSYLRRTS